jgi:5-dehydro-2-deoxygluconokinase
MLHPDRVYMLAADHRWQWEEWCDAHRIDRARISEVKELARRAFVLARDRSAAARDYGSLLLDEQYASASIALAIGSGLEVGTPAERAGAFPLAWAKDPFPEALTGRFVKVLVRHRADHPATVQEEQLVKLLALQHWCRNAGKPLVVEVLIPRNGEPEESFEASGRPAMLAAYTRQCYGRGLVPEFWKIEGTPGPDGARTIDEAIREHPATRQIILGKAADLATIRAWFAAARQSPSACGFAIGRSVFWAPSMEFLLGNASDAEAVEQICQNYLDLIAAWED